MKKEELDNQFSKIREAENYGFSRFEELSKCKIQTGISMIKRSLKKHINIDYVLADSWFICKEFIQEITKLKNAKNELIKIIGLMKNNRIIEINNKKINTKNVAEIHHFL